MALLWADGFDHYGSNGEIYGAGVYLDAGNDVDGLLNFGNPRTGPACVRMTTSNNGGARVIRSLGVQGVVVGMGFGLNLSTAPAFNGNNRVAFYFADGNDGPLISLVPNNRLGLTAFLGGWGDGGTVIGETADNVLQINAYQHIEFKAFLDLAVGTLEVRVNGNPNPVLLLTDTQTIPYATQAGIAGMRKYNGLNSGSPCVMLVDDWTVWDATGVFCNDFIGDNRCRTRFPATDGAEQQWTVHDAPNGHEALSAVPPGGPYLSGVTGDVSTFGLSPVPTNLAYCAGVVAFINLNKSNAGECRVDLSLISDDGETDKQGVFPGTGTAMYPRVFQTAPGGAVWTLPELQGARIKLDRAL